MLDTIILEAIQPTPILILPYPNINHNAHQLFTKCDTRLPLNPYLKYTKPKTTPTKNISTALRIPHPKTICQNPKTMLDSINPGKKCFFLTNQPNKFLNFIKLIARETLVGSAPSSIPVMYSLISYSLRFLGGIIN